MKIAIFGAGAIGGYLAVKLCRAGAEVSVVARGAHLAAMRERGLTLKSEEGPATVRLTATDKVDELGPQDYVIATLKANALGAAAPDIARLMGPDTALVTAINGIPYWYFYGLEGRWKNHSLESLDPGGKIWAQLPPRQVIGCIVYPAAEVVEPGVIAHHYGNRFSLGEPDGSKSTRIKALSQMLTRAGLKAPVRTSIRDEIWVKLWGNLAFNPMSALTSSTLDRLAFRADLRSVAHAMMQEAEAVGEALGTKFAITIDKRIDGAGEVGEHKTSMLQDLERGRPMEIDALLGAVVELAGLTGKKVPLCEAVLALVRERARQAGSYPA